RPEPGDPLDEPALPRVADADILQAPGELRKRAARDGDLAQIGQRAGRRVVALRIAAGDFALDLLPDRVAAALEGLEAATPGTSHLGLALPALRVAPPGLRALARLPC